MTFALETPEPVDAVFRGAVVRGLTLWRPWPWAFHVGKRVENRTWALPRNLQGCWLALHAGHRWDHEAAERMRAGDFGPAALACPPGRGAGHPEGVITALAKVRGSVPYQHLAPHMQDDPWAFGPWCWVISEYVELAQPVPATGAMGLWRLPPELWAAVEAQVP